MKKILFFLFLIPILAIGGFIGIKNAVALDQSQQYYQIDLRVGDGELVNTNIMLRSSGDYSIDTIKKELRGELYNFSGEKLSSTNLDYPEEGEIVSVKLPYSIVGREIKVIDNKTNNELLSINISLFAKMCGDGECQEQENFVSCPDDCPSGGSDRKCDEQTDGICDPDCRPASFDPDWPNCDPSVAGQVKQDVQTNENAVNKYKTDFKKIAQQEDVKKEAPSGTSNIQRIIIWIAIMVVVVVVFVIVMRIKERDDEM